MNFNKLNRKIHYWGALVCAVPVLVVILSGVLLLLKKESEWIQPSTVRGQGVVPTLAFEQILAVLTAVEGVSVDSWEQVKRIDIQPSKGVIKVQLRGNWEVQMDQQTGQVMQVAFRRSDIIESIHDGSFFHAKAKLGIFLPAAIVLLLLWVTGIYLFLVTERAKIRSRRKQRRPSRVLRPQS